MAGEDGRVKVNAFRFLNFSVITCIHFVSFASKYLTVIMIDFAMVYQLAHA